MTSAQNLATMDRLRVRAFPAQRGGADLEGGAGTGIGGPGYHLVALSCGEDSGGEEDASPAGTAAQAEEQYAAECEALASVLDARWGPSQMFSLWSLQTRRLDGEEIAEPWRELCGSTPYLHLWRVEDRWVALGVSRWDGEPGLRLMAVITEIDPP